MNNLKIPDTMLSTLLIYLVFTSLPAGDDYTHFANVKTKGQKD